MERCTLCGGKLANGKCTECGLDNTKNDKKYHLNVHNEKTARFHRGTCGDNLNRDNDKSRKKGGADAKTPVKTAAQRRRELKRRRETGTVRKKRPLARLVSFVIVLMIVIEFLSVLFGSRIFDMLGSSGDNLPLQKTGDSVWNYDADNWGAEENELLQNLDSQSANRPEEVTWDEESDLYFSQEMPQGFYRIGYEIPAGTYQFFCEESSAYVTLLDENGEYFDSFALYSQEWQKSSIEYGYDTEGMSEFSDEIELCEEMVVYVEDSAALRLTGERTGGIRTHAPQELSEITLPEGEAVAGEDFPAGVYDLILENSESNVSYTSMGIDIKYGEDMYFILLNTENSAFLRFPFEEGMQVATDSYAEKTRLKLIPSY